MSLQDQLRAENLEVADTGLLLTQAADRIDLLETQIADLTLQVGGIPALEARISELEGVLVQVRDLAIGVIGAV